MFFSETGILSIRRDISPERSDERKERKEATFL